MRYPVRRCVFLFAILGQASCVDPEGVNVSSMEQPREHAHVTGQHSDSGTRVEIMRVDHWKFVPAVAQVVIPSGRHTVCFVYIDASPRWQRWLFPDHGLVGPVDPTYYVTADLDLISGHSYEIRGEGEWSATPSSIRYWIADVTSGEIVWEGKGDASKPEPLVAM